MNRRSFFGLMVGGVATAATVRTFPFRVYSFASKVEPIADEVWARFGGTMHQFHDGSDLGRGSGTTYMRVTQFDDVARLLQRGFRPIGKSRYVITKPSPPFDNLNVIVLRSAA
jgi:hypothetical protein